MSVSIFECEFSITVIRESVQTTTLMTTSKTIKQIWHESVDHMRNTDYIYSNIFEVFVIIFETNVWHTVCDSSYFDIVIPFYNDNDNDDDDYFTVPANGVPQGLDCPVGPSLFFYCCFVPFTMFFHSLLTSCSGFLPYWVTDPFLTRKVSLPVELRSETCSSCMNEPVSPSRRARLCQYICSESQYFDICVKLKSPGVYFKT